VSQGMKFDSDKLRYKLIDSASLAWLAAVLTYGAVKYEAENWRVVDNADERYYDALMRHIEAWRRGERYDPESTLPHLCHAFFCTMCLLGMNEKDLTELPSRFANALKVAREIRSRRESRPTGPGSESPPAA